MRSEKPFPDLSKWVSPLLDLMSKQVIREKKKRLVFMKGLMQTCKIGIVSTPVFFFYTDHIKFLENLTFRILEIELYINFFWDPSENVAPKCPKFKGKGCKTTWNVKNFRVRRAREKKKRPKHWFALALPKKRHW